LRSRISGLSEDYATQAGYTIRFGDGRFGTAPAAGDKYRARYRLGPGTRANLAADTITTLSLPGESPTPGIADVDAVTNPLPVTNGVDPESASDIKLLTPEAYQAETLFAVRPEDYGEQAEKLEFVQRAQGNLRWTGSWHSVIASVDPFGRFTLADEERTELENHFDCVRQAGREVIVANPKFVSLDLVIRICVEPFAFPGQVKERILEILFGRRGVRPVKGFFDPDNFTFGTPLRRSALEAVLHDVAGVRSVLGMDIRPVGEAPIEAFTFLSFSVDPDQIIRLENDPLFPERGSLTLVTEGGG
jgi:predicted phage baseplate assembly protein